MDSEVKLSRSLPPLVEGKVHGYLELVVDEIVWFKRSPGDVIVLASWWGELDSVQFRLRDITADFVELDQTTTEIYAVKTNLALFKEYLKNCETVKLTVISEETHEILGAAQITELLNIFETKSYFRYFPILNNAGKRIGEIHVSLKLLHTAKSVKMQLKEHKLKRKEIDNKITFSAYDVLPEKQTKGNNEYTINEVQLDPNYTYRSILKTKRTEFQDPLKKLNMEITDKLVAQVVARAQKLRRAILKETYDDDSVTLSDSSMSDKFYNGVSVKDEAKLYEYFLGKEMSINDEHKALNALRLTSPTSSLVDLASETISACKTSNLDTDGNKAITRKINPLMEETSCKNISKMSLLDHVDSIRIFIESFVLSSAGYRRVKSSCLSHNDSAHMSVTYFVHYDTTFICSKDSKAIRDTKPTRVSSRKQVGDVIFFDHEGVYKIQKFKINTNFPLKFKMFIRHLNQKSPTELGVGHMHLSDIMQSENLSITQRLAIINKGIKIGELKITAELGCDLIHFGKHYVDAVTSSKENIPVMEVKSLLNTNREKCKHMTGTQSKTDSRVSSVSEKGIECLNTENSTDLFTTRNVTGHRDQDLDEKKVSVKAPESTYKDKVLLHGLIYVAEGKDLPELDTYLICRAFWREDRATSQVCHNTNNPMYRFCQLVPLIHGTDLLERIKDNYIIIEVYCKTSVGDNLLGIAKLPVHQLYVAYRDPLVLPHLLLSKYPVVSVDGWVAINNPITGQPCGQLLALVALGTAEQIALLEASRGLRSTNAMSQTIYSYPQDSKSHIKYPQSSRETTNHSSESAKSFDALCQDRHYILHTSDTPERDLYSENYKTQESQTDISTVKETKFVEPNREKTSHSDHSVLNALVDRLAHVLNTNKTNTTQAAQTEFDFDERKEAEIDEQMCLNGLNSNGLLDDSDDSNPRSTFNLPVEMYRSVGVGAEYDETDQQPNPTHVVTTLDLPTSVQNVEQEQEESANNDSFFRAVIEIECALHLPKIERATGLVEPSTYVTFQQHNTGSRNQSGSYVITNIFPQSCNPKWEWRYDTKLPTELLLNDEKRLILKIWRLSDQNVSMQVDLEKDVVIGFSAIDLSVLTAGFPTVSGWFHIMDFTGKCIGQIKVSITPLDNLASFGKSALLNTTKVPESNLPGSSWSSVYSHNAYRANVESSGRNQSSIPHTYQDENPAVRSKTQLSDPTVDITRGFEDMSMSFLSLSLKQKLTELEEITKRLQSRLRDVTNTAFEDEFENDFDLNDPGSDNENNDNRNVDIPVVSGTAHSSNESWPMSQSNQKPSCDRNTVEIYNQTSVVNKLHNGASELTTSGNRNINSRTTDTGYSSGSNVRSNQASTNSYYQTQLQSTCSLQTDSSSISNTDYPPRGTKTHINHLLDKLSLQLPERSFPTRNVPVKRDIIDLLASLQQSSSNMHEGAKYNNVSSIPTQTDNGDNVLNINENIQPWQTQMSSQTQSEISDLTNDKDSSREFIRPRKHNRMSAVIREELITEENNDTSRCDELSTYLITSNIRHMDLDTIFNPLLYHHLLPDLQTSNAISPEGEAVEQLDNRYVKTFNRAINSGLHSVQSSDEATDENSIQSRGQRNILESPESSEFFRLTPSGVSESIDGNIDLTVIHKSSNNDLMATNSTDSIATISLEKSSTRQTEMDVDTSLSESSVSAISRQAPEGGNPVEEITNPTVVNQQDNSQYSSSTS